MKPDPKNSNGTQIRFATAALLAPVLPALAADPSPSNLAAAKRQKTKLVDITCDATATALELTQAK
jgi:hypothetical protein